MNGPAFVIPDLVSELDALIATPMTKSQMKGQALLTREVPMFSQTLKVTQIPCLLGMCWNRVADMGFTKPLEAAQEEVVRETLRDLLNRPQLRQDIPLLLSSMRLLGVTLLSVPQSEGFVTADLLSVLESGVYTVPFLDDSKNDLIYRPPFSTPLGHYQAVLTLMEQELGPAEAEMMRAEADEKTFSVSFAAVRHLLVGAMPQEAKEVKALQQPKPIGGQKPKVSDEEAEGKHGAVRVHVGDASLPPSPSAPSSEDADDPDWGISGTLEL